MKPTFLSFAALGCLALASFPVSAQDAVTFETKWLNGKKYLQSMSMDISMKMSFEGQAMMDNKTKMAIEFSHSVSAGEGQGAQRIKMKYERLSMDMEAMGQKMAYDSANPDAAEGYPGFADDLKNICEKEFTLILDADGKLKDVEDLDGVLDSLGANGGLAKNMLSKENFSQMMSQGGLQTLPGKPIKPGESWPLKYAQELPGLGSITISGTYFYKGPAEKDGHKVEEVQMKDIKIAMETGGAGKEGPAAALGLKIASGDMSGTIWYDTTLGTARASEVTTTMTMSMTDPTTNKEIEIPIKQHITTTLKSIENIK